MSALETLLSRIINSVYQRRNKSVGVRNDRCIFKITVENKGKCSAFVNLIILGEIGLWNEGAVH